MPVHVAWRWGSRVEPSSATSWQTIRAHKRWELQNFRSQRPTRMLPSENCRLPFGHTPGAKRSGLASAFNDALRAYKAGVE